jgi:hypothetical protein
MANMVEEAHSRIDKFATYQDGWAFGEGISFKPRVVEVAKLIATSVIEYPGVKAVNAFPGRNGQIIVTGYYFEGVQPHGEAISITVEDDE